MSEYTTAKKKAGAKNLNPESVICTVQEGKEETKVRCGLKNAKLIEVNQRLVTDGIDLASAPEDSRERL